MFFTHRGLCICMHFKENSTIMIEFCFKFSQKNFWGVSKLPKLEENIQFLIFFMSLVVAMWKCKVSLGCKLNFIVDRNEPCGEGAT